MPSLRQLEYLVAIARFRHFRRAAEHCGVSQPTLSAQFRVLEERLGVRLVERHHARVLLTQAGEEISAIARRVLEDVDEMRHIAASRKDGLAGMIRLGVARTVGPYLLPRMISDLHVSYPELKLYVRENFPVALPPALEEGRHDMLVVPLPIPQSELETEALFREPLYLAMPSDHALARRKRIDRRDLEGQEVLLLEDGNQLHEQVEGLCADVGARPLPDYEGTSLDTLREMVGMGMGLSFLPGMYVETSVRDDPAIRVAPLSGPPIFRTIGLVWRRSSSRRQQFHVLADHFRDAVRQHFPAFTVL